MEDTYLLFMWCPVYRRHDSHSGFRMELENLDGDDKGKGTSGDPTRLKVPMHRSGAHCLVVARKRGNARGAKGAGHPRQDGVNGQPEELLVLAEAGRLPRGDTSRMNREIHVRICGGLGVQIPGSTQRAPRIHGELLKPGFDLSERSVSRWMQRAPMADIPQKPSRRHCCDGLLHRPNAHVWCSVLLFRDRPRSA